MTVAARAPRTRKIYEPIDKRPVVRTDAIAEALTGASGAVAGFKDARLFADSPPAQFIDLHRAISCLTDDVRRRLLVQLLVAEGGRLDVEHVCSFKPAVHPGKHGTLKGD